MSTIDTTINGFVEIGSAPAYDSPLTVSSTGAVIDTTASTAIYGTGTVVNNGLILESGGNPNRDIGIELFGGGYIDNTNSVISDSLGIVVFAQTTITNSGLIQGSREGINGQAAVILTNTGTISGGNDGLLFNSGGTVTNNSLITSLDGIGISGGTGTVLNTGSVGGGINLAGGGIVSNASGGIISGSGIYDAVYVDNGAGVVTNDGTITGHTGVQFYATGTASQTLTNSGTIIGSAGVAVAFGAGDDLMQLRPGNLFIQGEVDGGGGTNTLEFVSGASTGTLTGVGADFIDFVAGTVDTGANWVLAGSNTFGAGISLTNSGSLTDISSLRNDGTIVAPAHGGTGVVVTEGGTLGNLGTISAPEGYGVRINGTGTVINGAAGSGTGLIDALSLAVWAVGTGTATVINYGQISVGVGNGIQADEALYFVNRGDITGGFADVWFAAGGSLANYGTIATTSAAPLSTGVFIGDGGVFNNAAGALIEGVRSGIYVTPYSIAYGAPTTITNYGTLEGRYGVLQGLYHAVAPNSFRETLIDTGTVIGTGGTAVAFSGGNDLLVLENGFSIVGAITANDTGNAVELLGTSASTAVTANYNGLDLTGIQTVGFAPGNSNYATLQITNDAVLPGTIAGFTGIHDTIDLTGLSDVGNDATTSFNTLTNVLTVTGDNGTVQLQLDAEDYSGAVWTTQNDGSNGTDVTSLCFCAGAAIAIPGGEVPVECLKAGDQVLTAAGAVRRIVWVGVGKVLATRGRRSAATPVIVRRGAIAPNVPHRDLRITKAHSLFLDGVLVPVEFLVNHRSILWDDHAREVALHHVELETHDVLIANGAPAESYRDDGNRWLFQNANAGWEQPPKPPCAEVVTGGPIVDALWRRLLDRAGPRPNLPLTADPDLHLVIDGCRLDAEERACSAYAFTLPAGARSVRIASRAAAPAELGVARDPRILGVALRRVSVRAADGFRVIDVADDRLADGFHGYEADGDRRWTNGDAGLPADLFKGFGGRIEMVLHVDGTTRYPADSRSGRTAA